MITFILDETDKINYVSEDIINIRIQEYKNNIKKEKWNKVIFKNLIKIETFERMCG